MASSFSKKVLEARLTLANGTFDGVNNTAVLSGLRMEAKIEKGGAPSKSSMHLSVYGMPDHDMNALTTLAFRPLVAKKNLIQLLAGEDGQPLTEAFRGEIVSAHASYQAPPNLVFKVEAVAGYYPAISITRPKGYNGGVQVPQVAQQLATEMGYAFENNGVTTVLSSPYLAGTPMQQLDALAEAANIEYGVDDGTLFIAPRNNPRAGTVPLISPDTGLYEYPIFDKDGLKFKCLFNPGLQLGGQCKVQSAVPTANGVWRIHGLFHELSSEMPGGPWWSQVHGVQVGDTQPQGGVQ